jgi:flavin reductase (DIM6/NTAB) family NADH-FMN oxidoreductase RutF
MFYETSNPDHGLPHDPFKAIVGPRPIGWITTISAAGEVNLAPYSFFNAISSNPPCVVFSSDGYKHSVANIEETGEFVCNLTTWDLRDAVNQTSALYPKGVNEMEKASLESAPSRLVKPPRVAAAPTALECKRLQVMRMQDLQGRPMDQYLVIGQVVGIHIDDRFIKDGRLDSAAMRPIARFGYNEYAVVSDLFQMVRPQQG